LLPPNPSKLFLKQEQISRIKNKQLPTPTQNRSSSPTRKRTQNQLVSEVLQRIEMQQSESHNLLKKLVEERSGSTTPAPLTFTGKLLQNLPQPTELETAFQNFLSVFKSVDPNDRPKKIRKLVRECTTKDSDSLMEFMDLTRYELQKDAGASTCFPNSNFLINQAPGTSAPATEVYSKADLEKIDEFYREFLALPEIM